MVTLNYEILTAYLKNLANQHKLINDFTGFTFKEFKSKAAGPGLKYPALVLDGYKGKLQGTTQRTFNQREITFSIVIKCSDNFLEIEKAQAMAEQIGLSIFSRINYDSLNLKNHWLYKNFDQDSVVYDEIDFDNKDGVTGLKFGFDLKTKQPFSMNKFNWIDKSSYAFSLGFTKGFR